MDVASMLQVSVLLFLVAALGGVTMAGIRFAGKHNTPAWLAMFHGLLAAAGLTLLAYAALAEGVPAMAQLALLLLFLVAAGGGAVLSLRYKWNNLLLPAWLVIVHALAAVLGFVLLAAVVLLGADG